MEVKRKCEPDGMTWQPECLSTASTALDIAALWIRNKKHQTPPNRQNATRIAYNFKLRRQSGDRMAKPARKFHLRQERTEANKHNKHRSYSAASALQYQQVRHSIGMLLIINATTTITTRRNAGRTKRTQAANGSIRAREAFDRVLFRVQTFSSAVSPRCKHASLPEKRNKRANANLISCIQVQLTTLQKPLN